MKSILTTFLISTALITFSFSSIAQTISGDTQVGVSSLESYSYSGSYGSGYRWEVTGGSISSSSGLNVTILWSGAAGSGTVKFFPSSFAFVPHELDVTKYSAPPTPSTPSVSSNTCGNKTVTRGNPPSGITWYWQTSSNGTSTSNSSSTYTRTSSGYVYLRARRSSTGQWSSSSASVNVTVNQNPSQPSTPSVSSNSCGNKTVTRGTPPSGVTWYWQTSASGTSTGNSSTNYTVTSSRTVYLRARSSAGCWSSSRSVFVSVNPAPSTPPTPSVSSNSCGNKTVTKPGAPGGETYYWQTSSGGTSTSNSSGSITVTNSQNVYLRSRNDLTGCWSNTRTTYVTVNPVPATATGSNQARCGNGTVTLTASPGSAGNTIRWYSASSGGTLLHTGTSFTTPSLSSTTTYYAASHNSSTGCSAATRKAIQAIINPVPSLASGSNQSRCGNGTVTLTASPGGSGNTIRWYSASSGGTLLHTGTSYTTPSLSSSTTYYAASYNSSTGCLDADRRSITAVVNTIPTMASGSSQSRCGNGTVTLTASPGGSGNTIRWYSASSGGTLLHTGTSYTTPSLSSNTTYYAASYNSSTGCLDGDRRAITATVNPVPSLASGSNQSRCGNGTLTLTANPGGSGNTIRWYSASSGGTLLHTGTSYTTPSLSSNTTYYAASYNSSTGCIDSDRRAITAVVNAIPTLASGSNQSRCGNGTVTLTASPGGSGNTIRWYSSSSGGSLLHTGTSYTTPSLSSNTTYYAASYNSNTGCIDSDRRAITAVVNTIPTLASGSNQSRCGNGTVTLTASPGGSGNTIRWYSASAGGTLLHTGTSFTTPSISSSTTYYAASYNSSTGCLDTDRRAITAFINTIPTLASGTSGQRCGTGTVTLSASPGGSGNNIRWYSAASGGTLLHTGVSFTTPSISSTTSYYAASYNSSTGCTDTDRVQVTANIHAFPTLASGSNQSRCGNGTVTLTASPGGSGNTIRWYSASSGGALLHTGTSYTTPNLSSSTTYYAASYNTSTGCQDSDRRAIMAVVNSIPSLASGSDQSRCGNGTVTLTASPGGSGNTIRWYNASSGGTLLHTGTSYTTPSLSSSTTYYAASYNSSTGCLDADRRAITAVVNPIPILASGSDQSRCGNGIVTLTASPGGSGNTIRWYNASSGGTLLHTGTSYTTPSLSSSTTYFAASYNSSTGCLDSDRRAITAVINTIPALASGLDQERCGTGAVTLTATPGGTGNTIRWYSAATGGTLLHTGSSYTTPSISSSTTYYAASYNTSTGCQDSDRRAIMAVVNSIPSLASGSDQSRCGNGTVTLTASPGGSGNTIRWYNASSGGTLLHTGTSYTTPSLSSSTTYYAASYNASTGCLDTDRRAITAVVNIIPGLASGTDQARCGKGSVTLTATPGSNGNSIHWYSAASGGSLLHTGTSYATPSISGTTTYYASTYNSTTGCTDTDRVPVVAMVDAGSLGGSIAGSKEEFAMASGILTVSGQTGNILKWQYKTTGSWIDISGSAGSGTQSYTNVQETTQYRVVVKNGTCPEAYSSIATITILNVPSVDLGITQSVRPGRGTTLTASPGHSSYQWYRNNTLVQSGASPTYEVSTPGTYKVTVTSAGNATYTTGDAIISNQLEIEENTIITYTYREALDDVDDPFAYNVAQQDITAQIMDGLGRPLQQVSMDAGPEMEDIVVPMAYDDLGRQARSYLPYADTTPVTIYKPDALAATYATSDHHDYYMNISTHATSKAFSETLFESSPRNRPLEQGAPGDGWQLGQNTVSMAYAIADSAEVRAWRMEEMLTGTEKVYGHGAIFKNTTTDEDGNQTVEYTDKEGRTLLKKSKVNATTWAETYYVYDDYGNLGAVLPPEATSRLDTAFFQTGADRAAFLNTWAFLYRYDGRNRMTMKKVPGADSVFMVYDRWDRLVLTQDGNQRNEGQWLFTKYDELNRPIMTGLMNGGSEAAERAAVAASTERYDTLDASGTHQYSSLTYPATGIAEYLTVTYYDDYGFQTQTDWAGAGLDFTSPAGLTALTTVKGQVTGTMIRAGDGTLGTLAGGWIRSVSYYDNRYRVIETQSTNHLGGKDVVTNTYDFIGQVTESVTTHSNGTDTTTVTRRFDYDHVGRLVNTYHQLGEEDEVLLSRNDYNELGELAEKDVHMEVGQLVEFDSTSFTSYYGNDFTPNNWEVSNSRTLELGTGNVWKKYPLDYTITVNTILEFEYKSDSEGEIHGIGLDDDNTYTSQSAYKLHGTQSSGLSGYSYTVGTGWKKFRIPVGQNFSGLKNYITFIADDDASSNAEAHFRNVRIYEDNAPEQSLDYTYNIRGWLTSMNDSDLATSPDGDLFGFNLAYDQVDPGISNTALHNGNISGMKWSTYDDQVDSNITARGYRYSYDQLNRLESADHRRSLNSSWGNVSHYNTSYAYDLNGNIETLSRTQTTSQTIDDLTYTYAGNQLTAVSDAGVIDTLGFVDGNTVGEDYAYDANGNMVKDLNKGIDTIFYNHLNLPVKVILNSVEGDSITYLYDAAGIKLSQSVYDSGALVKTTDYVGEYIYETDTSGVRQLEILQHEEGRIVPQYSFSQPESIEGYDYQYHLKDHLGNVRLTFSTTPENYTRFATYEDGNLSTESEDFGNVDVSRVPHPSTTNTGKATALNSTNAVGTYAVIKVNKQDTVSLSVTGYYEGGNGYSNSINPAVFENTLETAIKTSPVLASEGVVASQIENGIGAALAIIGVGSNTDDLVPGAYLNYLYFDESMNLLIAENGLPRAGFIQISSAANFNEETISFNEIIANQEGYIIAYISNESNTANPVYFDDFTVYHGKTNIVSTQDYYPFGLTFNESVRTASAPQNFKFNSKERTTDFNLNWDHFGARIHMPDIGRFTSIDPLTEKYSSQSPYVYAANNPIRFEEKDGEEPKDNATDPPFRAGDNVNKDKHGNVIAIRQTTGGRKSMNVGIGFASTVVNPLLGFGMSMFYSAGQGDATGAGLATTEGVSNGLSGITNAASKDPIVGDNREMMKRSSKRFARGGTAIGLGTALLELFSPPTREERLTHLTFRVAEIRGDGDITYGGEDHRFQFGDKEQTEEGAANSLNNIFDVLSSALEGYDLTTDEGHKSAQKYINNNLKELINKMKEKEKENDDD